MSVWRPPAPIGRPWRSFLPPRPTATVSVVNPAQIKAFGASQLVRTKTDRVDAKLIAQFCAERRPEAWIAPSPAEQALRAQLPAPGCAAGHAHPGRQPPGGGPRSGPGRYRQSSPMARWADRTALRLLAEVVAGRV